MIKSICSRHDCDEPNENKTKTQQFVKDKQESFLLFLVADTCFLTGSLSFVASNLHC